MHQSIVRHCCSSDAKLNIHLIMLFSQKCYIPQTLTLDNKGLDVRELKRKGNKIPKNQ